MDRIITPYGNPIPHDPRTVAALAYQVTAPTTKTARDYLRALRKRWWLALALWLLVAIPGSIFVLRQPAIYQAQAEVELVPPQFDPALEVIVNHEVNLQRENPDQFVLNKIAQIKSKSLIDQVVHEFEPTDVLAATVLASELTTGLVTKRTPGTNLFVVTLDSRDQDRVEKILNKWLESFADQDRKSVV